MIGRREISRGDEESTVTEAPPGEAVIDWSAVIQQHSRWLRTVLLTRSGDPAAVEELIQEVALTAIRDGDSLRDRSRVGPWLYRIAVRQALLRRRRLGRQRRLRHSVAHQRQNGHQTDGDSQDPLGWLLADERSQLIRQALEALRPREAELLLLKYTEDWSYQQIAEHLGLTESAVDSRLHRARQRLRHELIRRNVVEVTS